MQQLHRLVLACLLALALAPADVQAADAYDVVIKGGRVLDPRNRIDGTFDVAIAAGKIARISPDIPTAGVPTVVRAAGMVVEVSVEGEVRAYAAAVEQTAYRVVQEALTNVHKHAAGAKTYVRLAHRRAEIAMQVENEPPAEPGSASAAGLPSGGNGLVGMRERVLALGGGFVSGPTDAGGFRVSAVIPAT